MNDDDLRQRFRELREEEGRSIPAFEPARLPAPRWFRLAAAFLVLIIVGAVVLHLRHRPTEFTAADRVAARRITEWRAPTDSLLPKGVAR